MKLLLLPASSRIPLEHFNDTVKNPISINLIKEFVYDESLISELDQSNSLWGFKKTKVLENLWNSINENDIALFLSSGEFYYQASVGKKFASESLAKKIWGTDKDGKTWELVFTLINGSLDPEFTWEYIKKEKGYSMNDRLQGPRYIDYIYPPSNTDINKYIPELESIENISLEGKQKLVQHIKKERNSAIVKQKKREFKLLHGYLYCEVCGFNFEQTYGALGKDYIECHHLTPISEYTEEQKTSLEDLALVCANCHRMIHRKKDLLSMNELRKLLKR